MEDCTCPGCHEFFDQMDKASLWTFHATLEELARATTCDFKFICPQCKAEILYVILVQTK